MTESNRSKPEYKTPTNTPDLSSLRRAAPVYRDGGVGRELWIAERAWREGHLAGWDDRGKVEPLWQPTSAPRWIIDRPPTKEDADRDDNVAVSHRPGLSKSSGAYHYAPWYCVHPGTPWAPVGAIPDEPLDPTCLDHNGWIRSRLPGEGDDEGQEGWVQIPPSIVPMTVPGLVGWAPLANIVPGQPWAPADSSPGAYEP